MGGEPGNPGQGAGDAGAPGPGVDPVPGEVDGRGFRAGLVQAVRDAGAPLALLDGEQLALGIDAGLEPRQAVEQARRVGRPRGAVNKRTGKVRDWLLARYAHPLEHLASIYSRPVDALASELGCSKLEAMQLQTRAAVELAPYIEGKQPVTLDVATRNDLVLIVPGLNAPAGAPGQLIEAVASGAIDPLALPDFDDFQADPTRPVTREGEE